MTYFWEKWLLSKEDLAKKTMFEKIQALEKANQEFKSSIKLQQDLKAPKLEEIKENYIKAGLEFKKAVEECSEIIIGNLELGRDTDLFSDEESTQILNLSKEFSTYLAGQ